ncbi:hypothetical protein HMPREF0591_3863 [Mycobacterium parascrofulaceum ATCC BAA-614]|uniref:Uncharacterized protein n=1 Tax=Mycobacterium parascrofulaceum ATCC BAA-614 TaxID=525368 RepID=D5PCG9_9MYCO|nr:hypothetical protein HMPREF0591_3863 [Mycobacterium parascrofulaceum ATCC BAA-614]
MATQLNGTRGTLSRNALDDSKRAQLYSSGHRLPGRVSADRLFAIAHYLRYREPALFGS